MKENRENKQLKRKKKHGEGDMTDPRGTLSISLESSRTVSWISGMRTRAFIAFITSVLFDSTPETLTMPNTSVKEKESIKGLYEGHPKPMARKAVRHRQQ